MAKFLTDEGLKAPKAIVFDWDGVLVETPDFIDAAFQRTKELVLPEDDGQYKNTSGLSLKEYFPTVFGERAQKAEKIFYEYVETHHLNTLKTTVGAQKLLIHLMKKNIPLFVVSNKRGDLLRKEVDYLSWNRYFNKIVGAGDCSKDKPAAVTVATALGHAGLNPSKDVWFVGDSAVDMECANNSGCTALLFETKSGKNTLENMKFPVNTIIFSCEDLINVVNNIKL